MSRVQVFLLFVCLARSVQTAVGRESETCGAQGCKRSSGAFQKSDLPAGQSSCNEPESWGKEGETWHLSKTFRIKVTELGCPSPRQGFPCSSAAL